MRSFLRRVVFKVSDAAKLPLAAVVAVVAIIVALFVVMKIESRSGVSLEALLDPDNFARIRAFAGHEPPGRFAVTVIDIDDATFRHWGQPVATPRGDLFKLIDAASRRQAALVLVDVDVTSAATAQDLDKVTEYLEAYAGRGAEVAPLLLMRRLWYQRENKALRRPASVAVPTYANAARDGMQEALAALEAVVEKAPNLIWSSPLHAKEAGGVVRSWRTVEAVCNPQNAKGARAFLAAAAIAADILEKPDGRAERLVALKGAANAYAQRYCAGGPRSAAVSGGASALPFAASGSLSIPFTFWRDIRGAHAAGTASDASGQAVPAVQLRSALEVLDSDAGLPAGASADFCTGGAMTAADGKQRLSCDLARGRAVLIGATHVDAQDSHVTPLGAMAGVDILANTLLGVRWMAQSDPPRGLPASALWGAILFLACVAAGRAFSAEAATVLIAVGLLIFAIASGYAGLDAAAAIAAIKTSLLMYGFYLLASAILAKLLKMLRARRLARARAQSTTQELLP